MEKNSTEKRDLTVFRAGLQALELRLSERQEEQFLQYYDLLTEWNSFMNLTAITEFDQVVVKHFLDSLALVKAWKPETAEKSDRCGNRSGISRNSSENRISGTGDHTVGFAEQKSEVPQ